MNMVETNFTFTETLNKRSKTARIILHHAAAKSCTAEQVHAWHLANGWAGIGYHYFIRKDGRVYRGRPENTVGAHAGNNNSDSIGICFEGNFEEESMPAVQKQAGAGLIADILSRYGTLSIIRHKDVNATACPGSNFPFTDLSSTKAAGGGSADTSDLIQNGDQGSDVIWLQNSLNHKGYSLTVDGIFGTKTLAAVKDLQTAFCIGVDGIVGNETKTALSAATPGDPHLPVPSSNIKSGNSGTAVRWVQQALTTKGYTLKQYGVDGSFGDETCAAVKTFQKAHQLDSDGIAGKNTRKALLQ